MTDLKLAYWVFDNGGCAYYRSILPFNKIQEKEKIPILAIEKGAKADDIAKCFNANVIQFARIAPNERLQEHMLQMKQMGIRLVLEYDDNVFKVNPYSPHYNDYGVEEYTDEMTGIKAWEDGKAGFHIEANKQRLQCIRDACGIVDMITVTQPYLAEVFRPYNDNIICLPNCVDPVLWQKLPLKRRDPEEVRLFWAGGCSHYIDWLHLVEPLKVIMGKYPQVKLVIMGQPFKATVAALPQDRIEVHPWVHFDAYPLKVSIIDPDIALIPLDENEFNSCKSNIKWVEMAAMGIPSVVSAVSPYFEHYNGKNMVAVDNADDAWIAGLSALIEDRIIRAKIGGEARKTVEERFDINKEYHQWLTAYKSLI